MNTTTIRKSASLIVLAPSHFFNNKVVDSHPFQVLLLKRNNRTRFMKSSYVFPGGVLDNGDRSFFEAKDSKNTFNVQDLNISVENSKSDINTNLSLNEKEELTLRICAIREAFEESGLILTSPKISSTWRDKIHQQKVTLFDACQQEKSIIEIDRLNPYVRWITPQQESRRYDTYFYVTRIQSIDELKEIQQDGNEMVDLKWISPLNALKQAKQLLLPPPTWKILRDLSVLDWKTIAILESEFNNSFHRKSSAIDSDLSSLNNLNLFFSDGWYQTFFKNQFQNPIQPHLTLESEGNQPFTVHIGKGLGRIIRIEDETLYEFHEEDRIDFNHLHNDINEYNSTDKTSHTENSTSTTLQSRL